MTNVRNLLNVEKDTNYSIREASMTSPTLRSASSCLLQRKNGHNSCSFHRGLHCVKNSKENTGPHPYNNVTKRKAYSGFII